MLSHQKLKQFPIILNITRGYDDKFDEKDSLNLILMFADIV